MNEDILKGKWLEIRGRVKENWGKIIDNNLVEIEGRGQILLGLLQKKYGSISDKVELEYKDSVELAEIVSNIRKTVKIKNDIMTISFIDHYGQPLFAKKPEVQITQKRTKNGNDTGSYFDTRLSRRNTQMAPQ